MISRGEFAGKIHPVGCDQLHQPVKLIRGNEGIDRIAEQNQVSLFQGLANRGKIGFIAFDALAHGEKGEGMFWVKGLEIKGRLNGGRVFALGAGV